MEFGAIAIWLLACLALGVLGWPLAAVLFPSFPDRGAAFSLPVSLVVLVVVAYWVGHLSITLGLAIGLLVLGVASLCCFRRFRGPAANEGMQADNTDETTENALDELWSRLRRSTLPPTAAVEAVAVFVLAFSFLLAIRAVDPAVHPGGGEKFLDFGLLASLLRASQLPSEDFWFAGEPIQYYYGGHLAASLLARLTGLPARYAYNLALATFYAMVVTAAYGLASAIATDYGASHRVSGLLGAFFVGLAANLVTALYALLWLLPASIAGSIAGIVDGRTALSADALLVSPDQYSYWTASRVIEGTVNEFPLFAWLNGDLHAHMMSTPFLLCVAAIGYAYTHTAATDRRRRRWLVFGVLPPLVGLLALVNTWSFPTALGLLWLSLTFASAHPATLLPERLAERLLVVEGSVLARELARIGTALLSSLVVLVGALCWSAPFWLESASGRGIAFVPDRSGLLSLLLVHGAFLAVFFPYLFDRARPSLDDSFRVGVALFLALGLALVGGVAAIGLLGPLLIVAWLLLRSHDLVSARFSGSSTRLMASGGRDEYDTAGLGDHDAGGTTGSGTTVDAAGEPSTRSSLGDVGYETVLLLAGVGLVLLVEFVYVDAGAGPGRYNTVFKTYMQVWVLWAVAVGVILARFIASDSVGNGAGLKRRGATVLVALLVLSTSLYAGITLGDHFTDRNPEMVGAEGPTIDALAFVSVTHPDEALAIRWLDARAGRPTIVSAPGTDTYGWANAPSSLTGVPTVAGWAHEIGYRGSEAYDDRVADVDRIYTGSPREQARLLRQYEVRYVYVGPTERERYGLELRFEGLRGLTVAYRNDAVTIYAVDRVRLNPRSASGNQNAVRPLTTTAPTHPIATESTPPLG